MMLMPGGPGAVPTGGAGVARPACSSSLSTVRIFFFDMLSLADFLDLQQPELDRRLAAEHVDAHFHLALLRVDLLDLPVEAGAPTIPHADGLADLVLHSVIGGF